MCNCNRKSGLKTKCGDSLNTLRDIRNNLVTLYNTSSNYAERKEYGEMKTHADEIRKSGVCPDAEFLAELKTYVENEFAKRSK